MLTPVFFSDLDPILKPTLILIPVKLEYELEFYNLDQTHELTPTLEPKLDLSFISESVSILIPFINEPKSSITQNHIPLLDQGLDQYDSVMIS